MLRDSSWLLVVLIVVAKFKLCLTLSTRFRDVACPSGKFIFCSVWYAVLQLVGFLWDCTVYYDTVKGRGFDLAESYKLIKEKCCFFGCCTASS